MKIASAFWHETMFEYDWNHSIGLPVDRQRNSDEHRTGRAFSTSFTFDDEIGKALINYALIMNISLLSLLLTCYYIFLFKLVNNETDLCVGMNVNSRYKPALHNIIGTFINL
jgi:hypothetical protein